MEAYTVVDNPTRKRMEEMLKTWKLPVAGALDTRPVFSPELVRPIENALIKAKAAMMPQTQQMPGRPRSAMVPHRDTPTPPGMARLTPQGYPHPYGMPPGDPAAAQMMYGQVSCASPAQNRSSSSIRLIHPVCRTPLTRPALLAAVDASTARRAVPAARIWGGSSAPSPAGRRRPRRDPEQ